ncbi:MAG TPA: hypothetical protein DDZ88_27485 [Verrucomicrobiales bacterium]|nr:hypothetical protein [Verrucomicrobiales bacterium]
MLTTVLMTAAGRYGHFLRQFGLHLLECMRGPVEGLSGRHGHLVAGEMALVRFSAARWSSTCETGDMGALF